MEKPYQKKARWERKKGAGTETVRSMIHTRDAISSGPKASPQMASEIHTLLRRLPL